VEESRLWLGHSEISGSFGTSSRDDGLCSEGLFSLLDLATLFYMCKGQVENVNLVKATFGKAVKL